MHSIIHTLCLFCSGQVDPNSRLLGKINHGLYHTDSRVHTYSPLQDSVVISSQQPTTTQKIVHCHFFNSNKSVCNTKLWHLCLGHMPISHIKNMMFLLNHLFVLYALWLSKQDLTLILAPSKVLNYWNLFMLTYGGLLDFRLGYTILVL